MGCCSLGLAEALRRHLAELDAMTPEQRIEQRYAKFRAMGPFVDAAG